MLRTSLQQALILGAIFMATNPFFAPTSHAKEFHQRYQISPKKKLRVNIDIDAAEVNIRKSPNDYEALVTMYYDEAEYRVESEYDETRGRLDIFFDKKRWVDTSDHNLDPEATIELPAGAKIDFDAEIKAGEIEIDLGGLTLLSLVLTTLAGEVMVDFSEPNQTEMEYLQINTKFGETEIRRLGNARFKEAEINGGVGEMRIDFRGALLNGAVAKVDLDIGETHLYMPEEVGVKLAVSKFLFLSHFDAPREFEKSGRYYYSKNYRDTQNELVLKVSPGLGELHID